MGGGSRRPAGDDLGRDQGDPHRAPGGDRVHRGCPGTAHGPLRGHHRRGADAAPGPGPGLFARGAPPPPPPPKGGNTPPPPPPPPFRGGGALVPPPPGQNKKT